MPLAGVITRHALSLFQVRRGSRPPIRLVESERLKAASASISHTRNSRIYHCAQVASTDFITEEANVFVIFYCCITVCVKSAGSEAQALSGPKFIEQAAAVAILPRARGKSYLCARERIGLTTQQRMHRFATVQCVANELADSER
ncbi:MAG: hypothetical protein JSR77_11895 [Planctomycetes bacterium]|nr:hypothetical protein [Planctomycetota bacterium]